MALVTTGLSLGKIGLIVKGVVKYFRKLDEKIYTTLMSFSDCQMPGLA